MNNPVVNLDLLDTLTLGDFEVSSRTDQHIVGAHRYLSLYSPGASLVVLSPFIITLLSLVT
jgi:hypothetical protein